MVVDLPCLDRYDVAAIRTSQIFNYWPEAKRSSYQDKLLAAPSSGLAARVWENDTTTASLSVPLRAIAAHNDSMASFHEPRASHPTNYGDPLSLKRAFASAGPLPRVHPSPLAAECTCSSFSCTLLKGATSHIRLVPESPRRLQSVHQDGFPKTRFHSDKYRCSR